MIVVALALLAGAPGDDFDGTLVRRVPASAGPITLARGASVFVEVESRLREMPAGDIDGRVTTTARGAGLSVVDWTEAVEIRPNKRGSTVHSHVIVRADPWAPLGPTRVGARVEVLDRDVSRPVAVMALDLVVNVVAPRAVANDVDTALRAYGAHQSRAEQGARIVPPLGAPLRLDRVEMPPRGTSATGGDRLALKAFLTSRLRADIARDTLRALGARTSTNAAVLAVTERAVRALGSLVDPPAREGTPRPPPLADPATAVGRGIALFDRLELEWAQRTLLRARLTPSMPVDRLADVLVRLGAIEAARGAPEAAAKLIGQALCLRPDLARPSAQPPMAAAFDETQRRGRCPKPLGIHSVSAQPATADGEAGVQVRVLIGPDPYHLVDRGKVELLDATDAVRAIRELSATRGDLAGLEVVFGDAEVGASAEGVRIRAQAFDVAGLPLARQDPLDVPLLVPTGPGDSDDGVAWWVWLVSGVAVVAAGATTAALVANGGSTPDPAIGPIDVKF